MFENNVLKFCNFYLKAGRFQVTTHCDLYWIQIMSKGLPNKHS